MNTPQTNLATYNNDWYKPGAGIIKQTLWYFTNILIIKNRWNPFSGIRVFTLRIFGAKIGKGVNIKPAVNIKYAWNLEIGNHSWIGEVTKCRP